MYTGFAVMLIPERPNAVAPKAPGLLAKDSAATIVVRQILGYSLPVGGATPDRWWSCCIRPGDPA